MGGAAVLVALARGASRVIAMSRNEEALARLSRLDTRVIAVNLSSDMKADAANISADGALHVVIDAMGSADSAVLSGLQSMKALWFSWEACAWTCQSRTVRFYAGA